MIFGENPKFDYKREPSRDILCIDCKSFYASVECVERAIHPLAAKLVVMSYPSGSKVKRGSGLILASSPKAKASYGITNVSRARDLPFPYPDDLILAPPRMREYMDKNKQINAIYKRFADESNHHVYSVDESFVDVTESLNLFDAHNAFEIAKLIQSEVYRETGVLTTIGIGDNPLLAKLALDNESKHNPTMIGEWRYSDVPKKVWGIKEITDFWGIGKRTAIRLNRLGIHSIDELAHSDYFLLKEEFGVSGTQLFAHAWGIDRTFLGQKYEPASKSIGNSQVLDRDYDKANEIEVVIKEMADQVGTRLRRSGLKAGVVSLWIGFAIGYSEVSQKSGFHQQMKVSPTHNSQVLADHLLHIFRKNYTNQVIRNIGVNCHDLKHIESLQLDLFRDIPDQLKDFKVDDLVDKVRSRYGFKSLVHAHSLLPGGRAIARSSLVGGHAGGMAGIEGEPAHGK